MQQSQFNAQLAEQAREANQRAALQAQQQAEQARKDQQDFYLKGYLGELGISRDLAVTDMKGQYEQNDQAQRFDQNVYLENLRQMGRSDIEDQRIQGRQDLENIRITPGQRGLMQQYQMSLDKINEQEATGVMPPDVAQRGRQAINLQLQPLVRRSAFAQQVEQQLNQTEIVTQAQQRMFVFTDPRNGQQHLMRVGRDGVSPEPVFPHESQAQDIGTSLKAYNEASRAIRDERALSGDTNPITNDHILERLRAAAAVTQMLRSQTNPQAPEAASIGPANAQVQGDTRAVAQARPDEEPPTQREIDDVRMRWSRNSGGRLDRSIEIPLAELFASYDSSPQAQQIITDFRSVLARNGADPSRYAPPLAAHFDHLRQQVAALQQRVQQPQAAQPQQPDLSQGDEAGTGIPAGTTQRGAVREPILQRIDSLLDNPEVHSSVTAGIPSNEPSAPINAAGLSDLRRIVAQYGPNTDRMPASVRDRYRVLRLQLENRAGNLPQPAMPPVPEVTTPNVRPRPSPLERMMPR